MRKYAFFALLIILSLPLLASAEIREGSFEINPFAGYCTTANSPVFCHKDIFGLRMGYNITDHWEIEGAYNKVNSSAELVGFDALYHLTPEKKFVPFVLFGVGYGHIQPTWKPHYDTMMADAGVGFKYFFTDNLAFRTEIRDVVTHSNNVIVSAGLTFSLGGKVKKTATEPLQKIEPAVVPKPEIKPEIKAEPIAPKPEVKPEPQPEPVKVIKPEPVTVVLEDIHFANNKYSLTPAAKEILQVNIRKLKENPGLEIEIQGHTSAIGSDAYNMKLSVKRAAMVRDYLIHEGIAESRLTTKGYGESMLLMPETKPKKESPAAKANRRVHFEITIK
jgi:OOP family OmpA-OmpF porin